MGDDLVHLLAQQRADNEVGAVELRAQIRLLRAAGQRRVIDPNRGLAVRPVAKVCGDEAVADRERRAARR
jgi:hypothetical protein